MTPCREIFNISEEEEEESASFLVEKYIVLSAWKKLVAMFFNRSFGKSWLDCVAGRSSIKQFRNVKSEKKPEHYHQCFKLVRTYSVKYNVYQ